MRSLLLASSALAALSAGHARAQGFPVIDIQANLRLLEQTIHNARDYAMQDMQLGKMIDTLKVAQRAYQEANAITNIRDASSALGYVQTRVPLPAGVNDVIGLVQGVSYGGSLSGEVVRFLSANRAYEVPGTDRQAVRINAGAVATAGQMAMAEAAYRANSTRLQGMDELQARLGTARTQAEKSDMIATATIENGRGIAQTNQLLSAQMLRQAQRDAAEEEDRQRFRQGVDTMTADADAVIAAGGRLPAGSRWSVR